MYQYLSVPTRTEGHLREDVDGDRRILAGDPQYGGSLGLPVDISATRAQQSTPRSKKTHTNFLQRPNALDDLTGLLKKLTCGRAQCPDVLIEGFQRFDPIRRFPPPGRSSV